MEPLWQGFLGFALVVGNWLSPDSGGARIRVRSVERLDSSLAVACVMDLGWNEQMTQLVDAGIPVRFRLSITTDAGDTAWLVRTLTFDVGDDAYRLADSGAAAGPGPPAHDKTYPHVLNALRDLRRWTFHVRPAALRARIEVELLRSRVSRLNRTVDMSQIWGQRRITVDVLLSETAAER